MPEATKRILTDETGQDIVSALEALTNVVDPNGTTVATAAKLNNMTISTTILPVNSTPTSSLTEIDGHFHLSLGIPLELPAVTAANNGEILKVENGTWTATADYAAMIGATSQNNGTSGLVPAPTTSDTNKFLRGDGSWSYIQISTLNGRYFDINGSITQHSGTGYVLYTQNVNSGHVYLLPATYTPQENAGYVAKYNPDGYLMSTTPSLGDSSIKVATTAFVKGNLPSVMTGATPTSVGSTGLVPAPFPLETNNFLRGDGTWSLPATMTACSSDTAGTAGLVPAPAAGDEDKFLSGDGTYKSGGLPMVILSYGNSTWQEFINAYKNNVIVYCRASSQSNPKNGAQTRMAFMAYVSDAANPTNVEFQYYRSMNPNNKSISQMSDQVYVYKLTSANVWSVEVREASLKSVVFDASSGLTGTFDKTTGTLTIAAAT